VPQVTIISDGTRTVGATVFEGRLLVAPGRLCDAIGWELKPEGLCRDEVCVPVRDKTALYVGGDLDVAAVAEALGRPLVVDADAGLVAIALDAEGRRSALHSLCAPSFTLSDLDGVSHDLEEWRGKKKLLVAFASW
jgi:hypothetical protein